jgi:hypothetical protein
MALVPVGKFDVEINVNGTQRVSETIQEDKTGANAYDITEAFDFSASFSGDVSASVDVGGDDSYYDSKSQTLSDSQTVSNATSNTDINLSDNGSISFNLTASSNCSVSTNYSFKESGDLTRGVQIQTGRIDKIELDNTGLDAQFGRFHLRAGGDPIENGGTYFYEFDDLAAGDVLTQYPETNVNTGEVNISGDSYPDGTYTVWTVDRTASGGVSIY